VFAYLLALRLQAHRPFSKLTITQIMRKLSRDHDLKDVLTTHFTEHFSQLEDFGEYSPNLELSDTVARWLMPSLLIEDNVLEKELAEGQ